MSIGPPNVPAQGAERVICRVVAAMMGLLLIGQLALAMASTRIDFGIVDLAVPLVLACICVARLKGWVRRGGGM